MTKTIVNGFWIGDFLLDEIQMLTFKSFINMGAEFHLWNYGDIKKRLPKGVVLRDANEILDKELVFKYPNNMYMKFGNNSYVGFSELFRYKLLHDIGGWWSDLDITCLKPIEETTDAYWFRFHGVLSVVANIIKCPPKSDLMKLCFNKAVKEVNSSQRDWHHAIRILGYYIEFLNLTNYIKFDECNLDRLDLTTPLFLEKETPNTLPSNWRFIHWMNTVNSKKYVENSVMDRLLIENNIKINLKI